jgi:uncharacterized protein (DUF4415 family)
MTENKNAIATDLKKLDAHVVAPAEYEDAPELTNAQLAAANIHEGGKLVRRGRPPSASRKQPVKLRLDPQVLESLRATGPGWQTLIGIVLQAYVARLKKAQAPKTKAKKKAATRRAARRPVRSLKTRRSASRSLHG